MAEEPTTTDGPTIALTAVSVIPGRVRWDVPTLHGNGGLARWIEDKLRKRRGIRSVEANAVTGRVLVLFDPALPVWSTQNFLTDIVADGMMHAPAHVPPAMAGERSHPSTSPPSWLNATAGASVIAGAGVALVATALAAPPLAAFGLAISVATVTYVTNTVRGWLRKPATDGVRTRREELQTFAAVARPYRSGFRTSLVIAFLARVVGATRILIIGAAINTVAYQQGMVLFGTSIGMAGTIAVLLLVGLVVTVLRAALEYSSQILWGRTARRLLHDLRLQLYFNLQHAELAHLQSERRSEYLVILNEDLLRVEHGLDSTWFLVDVLINCVLLLALLFKLAADVAWVALVPVPITVGLALLFYPYMRNAYGRLRAQAALLADRLTDSLEGLPTVKSFTAEESERRRIREVSEGLQARSAQALSTASGFPLVLDGLVLAARLVTYTLSGRSTVQGALTIGEFNTINMYTAHLLFPLTALSPHLDHIERGVNSLDRVGLVLDMKPEGEHEEVSLVPQDVRGEIVYDHLSFTYPGGPSLFRDLTLRIPAGSTCAIVGVSGSGKSTLIKLLLRFLEPDAGAIELDGIDVRHIRKSDLRRNIAVVSQDVYLFHRTIRENIAIGNPDSEDDDIVRAAQLAQAHLFISSLPHGYATYLGERGETLSGGQRQMIALARAILKDAPIVVLDEATASLDSDTEMNLFRALRPQFRRKTVLIVAHRLSTVRNADRIYVLEHGRVIEEGTHDQLVARSGKYALLWHTQIGEVS